MCLPQGDLPPGVWMWSWHPGEGRMEASLEQAILRPDSAEGLEWASSPPLSPNLISDLACFTQPGLSPSFGDLSLLDSSSDPLSLDS